MTLKQIRTFQRSAFRKSRQKELGIATRLAIAGDIALWEIAAQLAILNGQREKGQRGKTP